MAEPVYRRVVIKLSGEYLAGDQSFGIDQATVDRIAGDLIAAQKLGTESRWWSAAAHDPGRRSLVSRDVAADR